MVGPKEDETYDEYMYIASENKFELIGTTDIDLSQYVTNDEFEIEKNKIERLDDAIDTYYFPTIENLKDKTKTLEDTTITSTDAKTLNYLYAPGNHKEGKRAVATKPSDYINPNYSGGKMLIQGLKEKSVIGLDDGDKNTLATVAGISGWKDTSNGKIPIHELAFSNNGIYRRQGGNISGANVIVDDTFGEWKQLIDSENIKEYGINKKPQIDPVFANNSWETIKWISQYDDPSRYWKVGDWKMLDYPAIYRPMIKNRDQYCRIFFMQHGGSDSRPTKNYVGEFILKEPSKLLKIIQEFVNAQEDKYDFIGTNRYYKIFTTYDFNSDDINTDEPMAYLSATPSISSGPAYESADGPIYYPKVTGDMPLSQLLTILGVELIKNENWDIYVTNENINKHGIYGYHGWCYQELYYKAKQYPIMILGFNHDQITDVASYGKQKAGMTLCLGVSRGANNLDNVPPYDWYNALQPNLYESGVGHFDSAQVTDYYGGEADTMAGPYYKGDGKDWSQTNFRETLQHLLDNTELEDKIVAVDKRTAKSKFKSDLNYYSSVISSDKISLPSEYEMHGMIKYACGQEGEWYEFFKQGKSRFFWNSKMINRQASKLWLWSRSPWNSDKNSNPLKIAGGCVSMSSDTLNIDDIEGVASIDNKTTATTFIRNVTDELRNQYGTFYVVFNRSIDMEGTIENRLCLERDSFIYEMNEVRTPTEDNPSWDNFIIDMKKIGFNVDKELIEQYSYNDLNAYLITVQIGHSNSQVGYKPNAWGNGATGTLLPIFCL